MTNIRIGSVVAAALFAVSALRAQPVAKTSSAENWPQFRGPNSAGFADDAPTLTEWDGPSGDGVAWKTPIAGLAHSSPIVWGERLFVTTAVAAGMDSPLRVGLYGDGDSAADMVEHEWKVICLNKRDGKVLWEQTAVKGVPKFKRHTKATHANSTPCTDGNVVVACFGSEGLHAFSLDGEKRWSVDLGALDVGPWNDKNLQWGFAGSPIIHDGIVYLQCDVKERGFLVAIDAQDGREIWRAERSDVPGWCTPAILPPAASADGIAAAAQVVVNGCKHMGGYDAKSGTEIWRMANGGGIPVPAPVIADGLILLTTNHRPINKEGFQKPIFAVRATARGDITFSKDAPAGAPPNEHVAWFHANRGNYMQTPLAYRGRAYFCADNGAAACYDLKTGVEQWRERLGRGNSGFSASPVAADGKLYWTSEDGDVYVIGAGAEFNLLSMNALGEICMASPAVSEGRLYFRTQKHVIAVGAKSSAIKIGPLDKARVLEIARQAVSANDVWIDRAEFATPQQKPDGSWDVTVWRLRKTPGGHRLIQIGRDGNVTAYLRGA